MTPHEQPPAAFRFLVMDDDPISREKLCALLKSYGICESVASGQEALGLFRQALETGKPYHLVTVDLVMPEIDGYDVIRSLRYLENEVGRKVRTPIWVAASSPLAGDFLRSFQDGCDWYITKPFTPAKIRDGLVKVNLLAAAG